MDDKTMLELAAKAAGIVGQIKDHGGALWLLNREDGAAVSVRLCLKR